MSDIGDPGGAQLSAELSTLDVSARRVLAALAVLGGAPVSAETLGEISGVADARRAVEELDRRRLITREHGDRVSVAPEVQGRLKSLLATDDEVDAVVQGLIRRAEDGRLSAGDIDAVDEATRVSSETGRWPQVLRLAQASEPTLSATHRLDAWTRITERRLEAARSLGDEAAAAHAQRQLNSLAVMGAPTEVMGEPTEVRRTATTEVVSPPPARQGTNWPLAVLAGLVLAAAGASLGYLIADQTSEATTVTESSPTETDVVTETATGTATTVEVTTTATETTTVTETATVTETQTVTVPG